MFSKHTYSLHSQKYLEITGDGVEHKKFITYKIMLTNQGQSMISRGTTTSFHSFVFSHV